MGRATGRNNKELGALQLMQGLLGTIGSAGRGLVAGTAGLPGDIESLVRLLPGFDEKTVLPTTEKVSKALPQLPASYRQPVAEGMGQMGAMTPGQVAKLGKAAKTGALALADRALTPSRVAQAGAVKPRGGNWLKSGGTEYIDELLQRPPGIRNIYSQEQINFEKANPTTGALNNWVRGPMTKYVKRDLGTAEDPLLRLADEGISTLSKEKLLNPPFWAKTNARESRKFSGLEQPDLGGYSQGWSDLADGMVRPVDVGGIRTGYGDNWREASKNLPNSEYFDHIVGREGEWLGKLPDEARVYQFSGDEAPWHLGFDNLVDSLRTGMDPATNLPPGLRLKPEDLQQMGMEKAVRYMGNVEKFKAAEAEQASAKQLEAMGKQGTLRKEYPTGHRIVELNKPEKLDEEMLNTIRQNADGTFSPIGPDGKVLQRRNTLEGNLTDVVEADPENAYLGGMLANEGNAMQHCVGGYCGDVVAGTHKVYSVRDAKGEPHTTIELVHPMNDGDPWEVSQVYGKQNTQPKAELLPAIQDFIRSNGYSVGDSEVFKNAGLRNKDDLLIGDDFTVREINNLRKAGHLDNLPQYMNQQEVDALKAKIATSPDQGVSPGTTKIMDDLLNGEPQQFAAGGLVATEVADDANDFSYPGYF